MIRKIIAISVSGKMAIIMKESIDSKDLPSEGFEENLKSEIKLEDISEITETVEFDVKIKEKTIESKDFKETEGILIGINSIN